MFYLVIDYINVIHKPPEHLIKLNTSPICIFYTEIDKFQHVTMPSKTCINLQKLVEQERRISLIISALKNK